MSELPAGAAVKSVAQKLLIKPGQRLLLVNAPDNVETLLGQLPECVEVGALPNQPAEVVLLFARRHADLENLLPEARAALTLRGSLWVAYPKGKSGVKTDLNRDTIWRYARTMGMDAVSIIAIDELWSALRLKIVHAAG